MKTTGTGFRTLFRDIVADRRNPDAAAKVSSVNMPRNLAKTPFRDYSSKMHGRPAAPYAETPARLPAAR
jgi:hypothetical protein